MQTAHPARKPVIGKRERLQEKPEKKQVRRRRKVGEMDAAFLLIVLILLAFGLIMVFSASYANALYYEGDSLLYIKKQGLFAVVGVAAMLLISRVDYRAYKKLVLPLYFLGIALLVIVLFFEHDGARRWVNLGPLGTFQPSEYMKFAVIVVCASLVAANCERMQTRSGFCPFLLALGPVVVLLLLEPHMSGTLIICAIAGVMMFVGGTRLRYFAILLGALAGLAVLVLLIKDVSYITSRLENWWDPFGSDDLHGAVWQTCQSLIAIGSGGVMGLGLGNSQQKYLYLPEPQNDFIFAIVCEELGLIGAVLVIALFVLLVYRGFSIANQAPDKFGAMLAIGITVQIGLQALLNIAVVSNAIPNTGISLPFFSYGGTALLMQLGEMGVLLNISRHAVLEKG